MGSADWKRRKINAQVNRLTSRPGERKGNSESTPYLTCRCNAADEETPTTGARLVQELLCGTTTFCLPLNRDVEDFAGAVLSEFEKAPSPASAEACLLFCKRVHRKTVMLAFFSYELLQPKTTAHTIVPSRQPTSTRTPRFVVRYSRQLASGRWTGSITLPRSCSSPVRPASVSGTRKSGTGCRRLSSLSSEASSSSKRRVLD